MAMPKFAAASAHTTAESITVDVLYSPGPRVVQQSPVQLPAGCQLGQALPALAQALGLALATLAALDVGVWGLRCPIDRVLLHGERIEFYRPLRVDPKVARRERFASQGAKSAGLFAKKRPCAKAGY